VATKAITGYTLLAFLASIAVGTLSAWKPSLSAEVRGPWEPQVAAVVGDNGVNDPIEPVNRAIFGFNRVIHNNVLGPVARAYNDHVPADMRLGIGNFLNNLSSPITMANHVLQGDIMGALHVFVRLFINSTIGIGGMADVVSEVDGEARDEDFGQTLGVWGMGEGFYLVLPIFGPSSPRDTIGKFLVDGYFDPFGLYVENTNRDAWEYSETAASGVDEFAGVVDELEQIEKTSVDYYAAIRSLYRQKRKSLISNGKALDLPPIPNLSYNIVPEDFGQSVAGVESNRVPAD